MKQSQSQNKQVSISKICCWGSCHRWEKNYEKKSESSQHNYENGHLFDTFIIQNAFFIQVYQGHRKFSTQVDEAAHQASGSVCLCRYNVDEGLAQAVKYLFFTWERAGFRFGLKVHYCRAESSVEKQGLRLKASLPPGGNMKIWVNRYLPQDAFRTYQDTLVFLSLCK